MILRTAATTAALAVALAVVGAVTGPQWDPDPVPVHIRPAASDTTIGGQTAAVRPVGTYEVREKHVTVQLDGTSVDAIIRTPIGVGHDVPGTVFVHGAGTAEAATSFVDLATRLASAGVATLVPTKRSDTYTTRHRDYVLMAADYERSVEALRAVDGVDPDRVGAYGESEGTWIVPVMAAHDPKLAFQVLVSAPVVPPRQQAAFAVDSYLRNTDVPHGVFRAIPRAVGMVFPGGGFEYADFDVEPWLEADAQPILVVYGGADPSMPVEQGARQVIDAAAVNGHDTVTVRYYQDANHGIKVDQHLVPEFPRDVAAWIVSLPTSATAPPRVAGAAPDQRFLAAPVPTPRWLGDGDVLVAVLLGGALLLVLSPGLWTGTAVWRRLSRHEAAGRLSPGLRLPLVGVGIGAVVTLLGLVLYLVAVARLALDYEKNGWVVTGGWIAVRLLGIATLVPLALIVNRAAELRTARRVARGPDKEARVERTTATHIGDGLAPVLTFWGVLAGSLILLVLLAYWGVYQMGI